MKKIAYITIFLIIGSFVSLELYRRSKSSLEYSILQVILAIRNKNEADFRKYVNIDKVVHLAVNDFVNAKRKSNEFEIKESLDYLGNIMGSSTLVLLKPQIEEKIKEKIRDYFASKEDTGSPLVNRLVHTFNRITLKMKFDSSIGEFQEVKYVKRGDYISELGIGFKPESSNKEIVVKIQLVKKSGIWVVDRIPNITEIIDALEKSQKS